MITISEDICMPVAKFKELDYYAIDHFDIPIELMMENAGLQLARLTAQLNSSNGKILTGIGTGNNGGGGLVAARRLAGWGYQVFLDLPVHDLKPMAAKQLSRAVAAGVVRKTIPDPVVFYRFLPGIFTTFTPCQSFS